MDQPDTNRSELASELAAALPPDQRPQGGSNLYPAVVAGISGSDVILELGPRVQGAVALEEFPSPPEVGAELQVALKGREDGLWLFSIRAARTLAAWEEIELGSLVKGTVVGVNKGGLELKVDGVRAFLPASHVALSHVEDLTSYANQTLVCEVIEIDREKRSMVVSRRAVLEEEKRARREESMQTVEVGSVVTGRVTRLESFGAFVEIAPGIEGLLHVSNMAYRRVERPEDVVSVGDVVEVMILEISEGGRRIGLGRKQLEADPWDDVTSRLYPDAVVQGTVRRIVEFGAFVEVEAGIEGLLHVSQLGEGRVRNVRDVLSVGQELSVRVLSIDAGAGRISLSRLDPRGAVIGSDESVSSEEIDAVIDRGSGGLGTSLGDLFKKALDKD